MAVEIKFTCNLCKEVFYRKDGKSKIPLGWGAVRPTLRINMPTRPKKDEDLDEYFKFEDLCKKLKKHLFENEHHICHKCLKFYKGTLLKVEGKKEGMKECK